MLEAPDIGGAVAARERPLRDPWADPRRGKGEAICGPVGLFERRDRVLESFFRHRDRRSVDHYAKPPATTEAIVKALRPQQGNRSSRA